MAFEGLADKLGNAFKKLKNKGKLSEKDVKEAMREVRLALLEADVNYKVAKDFTNKVTERAVGQDVMQSLTPAQMVVKIVDEELTSLMGGEDARIEFASKPPTVIMMCGLQGSGKTTHTAKLAKMLKKQGRNPLLAACDVYRPAAIDQLKVVGEKAGVPVFEMGKANPVKIAKASPPLREPSPITAMTLLFSIPQADFILMRLLWMSLKTSKKKLNQTKFCLLSTR